MEKNSTKELADLLIIEKEIISSVEKTKNESGGNGYEYFRSGITITSSIRIV